MPAPLVGFRNYSWVDEAYVEAMMGAPGCSTGSTIASSGIDKRPD